MGNRAVGRRPIRLSDRQEARLVDSVAALTTAGLPLCDAYDAAAEYADGTRACERIGTTASAIARRLRTGESVCDATEQEVSRVHPIHAAMLRVVDETGDARRAYSVVARFLARRIELRSAAVTAMVYPGFVLACTVLGVAILARVVIPGIAGILSQTGAAAHPTIDPELILRRARTILLVLTVVIAAGAIGCLALRTTDADGPTVRLVARLRLSLPVIGSIELLRELLTSCTAVECMVVVGIGLDTAIERASSCVSNRWLRGRLAEAADRITAGVTPSAALLDAVGRRGSVARWFALAENGVPIVAAVHGLATDLDGRIEQRIALLRASVEPASVALAGSVLLIVVVAVLVPLIEIFAGAIL
ncbi:MAG: hypothetical protein EA382_02305 [Spirochaetaceae bacterium]|nr:MAG: hypothetical protein EA382_02305 [Spirochaetaceae bacterium]